MSLFLPPDETLAEMFKLACSVYFPDWRDHSEWQVISRPHPKYGTTGYSDPETKCIYIDWNEVSQYTDFENSAMALMIHEVAHSVCDCGHTADWRAIMDCAADRAEQVGNARLAFWIRNNRFMEMGGENPQPPDDLFREGP